MLKSGLTNYFKFKQNYGSKKPEHKYFLENVPIDIVLKLI